MRNIEKILFATDFSDNSEDAFQYALTFARRFSARLILLHVINEPVDLRGFYVPHISFDNLEKEIEEGARKMMAKFCSERLADFPDHESHVVSGIPADEIIEMARKLDCTLIVLGTHGRTGLDHILFGSTAERVVRHAPCPVLTVRQR